MKNSGRKDEYNKIEELFTQFPMIEDHQDRERIFQYISKKRPKKAIRFFPAIASIVSILLLSIIGLQFYADSPKRTANHRIETQEKGLDEQPNIFSEKLPRYGVQPGQKYITYGFFDAKRFDTVVPISLLVESKEESSISRYKENAGIFPVNEWGLAPFELGNLNSMKEISDGAEGKKVLIDLPVNSSLSVSSSGGAMLTFLKEALYWNQFDKMEFQTDGAKGALISNKMYETLQIPKPSKRAYYEYMYDQDFPVFLVPSKKQFHTFEEALQSMDSSEPESDEIKSPIHPPIPGGVDIGDVRRNGTNVTVEFTNDSGIMEHFVSMADAILFTAREFGFETVTFTGAEMSGVNKIGTIKFNSKIAVPVAPNPVVLE